MNWTTIYPLTHREWHSAEVTAMREEINTDIQELEAGRKELDEQNRALEELPLQHLAGKDHIGQQRQIRIQLLQSELEIRSQINDFCESEEECRRQSRNVSFASAEVLEKEILERLYSIGFAPPIDDRERLKYQFFIKRHPEMRRSASEVRESGNAQDDFRRRNTEAIKTVTAVLEQYRNRMLKQV